MKQLLTTLTLTLLVAIGYGQVPARMSYQSTVRNSTGNLMTNSPIGVRISILQGAVNGPAVYTETHNVTSNTNGLLSLEIGGGASVVGSMASINWALGPFFVKTETDPAGGTNYTLAGTSQLLSVPYALYAERSGSSANAQWATDATGIYYNSGKVAIGTPSSNPANSSAVLSVNGAMDHYSGDIYQTVQRFRNTASNVEYQFNVAGSNNNDFAQGSFGIYNNQTNTWILNNDGATNNVGIGSYNWKQSTPKSKLHIFNGDVNINDIGKGIIMKSPNGQCWRVTVGDTGAFVSNAVACP